MPEGRDRACSDIRQIQLSAARGRLTTRQRFGSPNTNPQRWSSASSAPSPSGSYLRCKGRRAAAALISYAGPQPSRRGLAVGALCAQCTGEGAHLSRHQKSAASAPSRLRSQPRFTCGRRLNEKSGEARATAGSAADTPCTTRKQQPAGQQPPSLASEMVARYHPSCLCVLQCGYERVERAEDSGSGSSGRAAPKEHVGHVVRSCHLK